jgi:endoglucanase
MYSSKPTGAATWLVDGDVAATQRHIDRDMQAAGAGKFPVFTFYRYYASSGADATAYRAWVTAAADAIGKHSGPAVVVLEPDLFALQERSDANAILDAAIGIIKSRAPRAALFLDIGHSAWLPSTTVVSRAKSYRNFAQIDGWASNTSNFQPTSREEAYARELFAATQKPAIIDTSRNGLGRAPSVIHNPPESEWDPGARFAWHAAGSAVLFNYHNKPYDEGD